MGTNWSGPGSPGIADDQAAEHCPDTGSRTGHPHRGCTGTNELGGRVDVPGDGAGLEPAAGQLWVGRASGLGAQENKQPNYTL